VKHLKITTIKTEIRDDIYLLFQTGKDVPKPMAIKKEELSPPHPFIKIEPPTTPEQKVACKIESPKTSPGRLFNKKLPAETTKAQSEVRLGQWAFW
jgi:hypothetical protein